MESVGYPAVGFPSAEELLSSTQSGQTGCLILDVRMPGMGSFELQRQLAAAADHTPIIFITAHAETNPPPKRYVRERWLSSANHLARNLCSKRSGLPSHSGEHP